MNLAKLYYRCRWLHGPAGLLVVLLQRTPVLRVFSQAECFIVNNGGAVIKSVFGLAALGAYNSVAGATTFGVSPATPTTGPVNQQFGISGTVGTAMSETFTITGAPGSPRSWSITGSLPPGLSVTGGNPVNVTAPYKMTIVGTPTTAGNWTVTATAWSSSNASGDHGNITCAFSITGGVANTAPTFTSQPQNATVTAGGSVTFTAAATGSPAPTFQWLKGGAIITGATSSTYTIASAQASDAGSYTVAVGNSTGSVTSSAATLTVQTVPFITTQPLSATVAAGSGVAFSVVASGTAPLSYQWQKGGANIIGATAASYSITSAQTTDAGSYTLVVSNSIGSVTSSAATLTVQSPPTVATQPLSASATAGNSVTFSVLATGTTPLSYQWLKGGSILAGATAASFTIASVQTVDVGNYTVVVSNPVGSVTSNVAALTVFTSPVITTQPQNISVTTGSSATFSVVAGGSTPLGFQWQKAGVAITGATSATYTISNAQTSDVGSYTVVVSNNLGSVTSAPATLTVTATAVAPLIATQPQSVTVTAGGNAILSVTATGSAPIVYQWQKGGVSVAGATNASLTLNSVQAADAGNYTVVVTNSVGTVTSSIATLTVNAAPVAPSITTQPQSTAVIAGSAATFAVTASGAVTYQWYKGGVIIAGATSATYTISSTQAGDTGIYTVVVGNSVGSVTSSAATLTVNAAAVAPTITAQPQSATVTVGSSVSFGVTATGTGPFSYQWLKGGTAITGATSASYTIPSAQVADAALYTVIVNNSAGAVTSSSATLTVNLAPSAPTISTQPKNETVATGHDVSFSIAATSSLTASYQWSVSTDGGATWTALQDNANYTGTTKSTLTVHNVTVAMNGYLYRCAASNSAGSVNSNALTLMVAVAIFPSPVGLAINSAGVIYVSDSSNNTIQSVSTSWQASALAGTAGQQGTSDGAGAAALFRQPGGVALDSTGNLYVADTGNSIIRRITSAGVVTTVAGSASNQGYRDGVGTAAWFNSPAAIAVDSAGNLYVADAGNAVIRKIASDGTVSTIAGTAGATGNTDGSGASARFNQPSGIAVDGAGNLYVSDTLNQTIRKVSSAGLVTTLAGLAGISGSADGSGTAALFSQPRGLVVDSAGSIYVADTANSAIRKVTSAGVVTTVAGLSTVAGLLDGTGIGAWLNQPRDIKIDTAGNLYVADTGNAAIRKITPTTVVTTPVITAGAAPPVTPPGSGGLPTPSTPPPPGKSGGGSMEGWFVLGLFLLASAGRALAKR